MRFSFTLVLYLFSIYTFAETVRPVSTYSIVAIDPETKQLGIAIQSHWFSVGSVSVWAEAEVGVIATQSFADPTYGTLGLELIRHGKTAPQALAALISTDDRAETRQVAMIDASGNIATHTGNLNIQHAGHHQGINHSAQANMMEKNTVWEAMGNTFEKSKGDLAERLLLALEAAQKEGGDIRGKQSAAILIVSGESTGKQWEDRVFDLRVEDNPQPVQELRRLVEIRRAYLEMANGDQLINSGKLQEGISAFQNAADMLNDNTNNGEIAFWTAVTLASTGNIDQARPYFQRAYEQDRNWAALLTRLQPANLLSKDLVENLIDGLSDKSEQ